MVTGVDDSLGTRGGVNFGAAYCADVVACVIHINIFNHIIAFLSYKRQH